MVFGATRACGSDPAEGCDAETCAYEGIGALSSLPSDLAPVDFVLGIPIVLERTLLLYFSIAAAESLRTRGGADMPSCAEGGELPSTDAWGYPPEIAERE
jgi:hypothetical protein